MQGPALAHGAERGFCRPALRGIRQQQAVMAAHAVTIQIAQKRALLHHAFQSQPSCGAGCVNSASAASALRK